MDAAKPDLRADDLISFRTIAEAASVSMQTVANWVGTDAIPVFRQGDRRKKYILREDAEKLLRPQAGRTPSRVSA